MWKVIVLIFGVRDASRGEVSDADLQQVPRLFHLDDYARCLARPQALYCMATFRLIPMTTPHPIYDFVKNYSSNRHSFDRTLIHRGYCVTSRCACAHATDNTTSLTTNVQRFEACVEQWARPLRLRTQLHEFAYCREPEDRILEERQAQEEHSPHQLLLKITLSILFMNLVGTVYDLVGGKNKMVEAWSVRSNWRRLVAVYDADERLTGLNPLQGFRVFLTVSFIIHHVVYVHCLLYTYNPSSIERLSSSPLTRIAIGGGSIVAVFVLLTNFLLAYNVLIHSTRQRLSLALIPKAFVARFSRICPVYMYVLLFATSWWPLVRDGPMWHLFVSKESNICKRKFWAHALYIHNYVDTESHCLAPTWYLAVDMQLYAFAVITMLTLAQLKLRPLPILKLLFIVSCILNIVLAYINNWKPASRFVFAEKSRSMFRGEPSMPGMYFSAWAHLPSCILGLYVAHKHYQEELDKLHVQHSFLFKCVHNTAIWLFIAYMAVMWLTGYIEHPLLLAVAVALEKPILTAISAVMLYGICKRSNTWLYRVSAWGGFRVMARLSLGVLTAHWCVISLLLAARPAPFNTSPLDVIADATAACGLSYMIAVPLSILLEMPCYRCVAAALM